MQCMESKDKKKKEKGPPLRGCKKNVLGKKMKKNCQTQYNYYEITWKYFFGGLPGENIF